MTAPRQTLTSLTRARLHLHLPLSALLLVRLLLENLRLLAPLLVPVVQEHLQALLGPRPVAAHCLMKAGC